nr:reverse transcriptase domain-containing protein [Tanacetum cinerariifolium]
MMLKKKLEGARGVTTLRVQNTKCGSTKEDEESPRHGTGGKGRRDGGVFNRLGDKGKSVFAHLENRYQSYRSERTESIPIKRHHESTCSRRTEMFFERAPECMRIFRFMHGITNPKLIKRLHDNIPKLVDEMMRVTTTFLRGEVAVSNQARKKTLRAWKQQEAGKKQKFDRKGDFRNQQRSERRRDKFTLLTRSPKFFLALDKDKFKAPSLMKTLTNRGINQEWKLSHVIKELKHGSGKDQPKASKKGETSNKDKPMEILMVQPCQRVVRQKFTQCFSLNLEILFPPLGGEDGAEGPMIVEAEI